MSTRFPRTSRCRNCLVQGKLPPPEKKPAVKTTIVEGDILWNAALVSCGSSLELLFRYVALDLPGNPVQQLKRLQSRLAEVTAVREDRERTGQINGTVAR